MKIERINENQIRCTLTSFDLSVRNLNLGPQFVPGDDPEGFQRSGL